MSGKVFLAFCVQTILIQFVLSQCTHSAIRAAPSRKYISTKVSPSSTSPFIGTSCGYPEIAAPAIEVIPTNGGALPVTCVSAYPQESVTVTSENVYEGTLTATGELPFVGTVSVKGELPSSGTGVVNHACGSRPVITAIDSFRPAARNSVAGSARGIPSNLASKRGFGSSSSNLKYADASAAGLGSVNGVRAAAGVGNGRYGGSGEGSVAVVGELPVAGSTVVVGQLPISGAVSFNGLAPAAGSVTIAGSCVCDRYL